LDESGDNPIRDESSDNPIRDESSDNPIRDESDINLLKNKFSEKKNIVKKFIKKYYKKICLLTHPDKTNDLDKNEIFKKAKDNMENNFLIGIIKNAYDLKIKIDDLNEIIIEQILIDIRIIQEKIIEIKKYIS
jgi:DnaJ-class molecular chaperone